MADSLIGSLRVALSLGTADFEAGANKAAAIAKSKAKEIEGSFISARAAVTGFFAAFTVGALTEVVKKSLDYAGSLAEVSRTLGVTTKDLQTFRFAATQSGVAQDQLEVGLRRLTVSIGKAELGSKAQIKAFDALGISVDQLKGKTTGDVFRMMADSLSKVTDRSQRAAIEMILMGRSGSTLDNLLAPGAKRLNELAEAAQTLGIVLSDSQIQNAEVTAHKLEAVKMVLSAQIAGVVADNAGAILSLSSALATLTSEIVRFLGSNPQLALGIIGALLGGRIGGLPGAVIGGAAGAILGGKVGQIGADSNPDLQFRIEALKKAQEQWIAAKNGSQMAGLAGAEAFFGGRGIATDEKSAYAEWARQKKLLDQAVAQNQAANQKAPPGVDLPKFLGGGGKKKKAPEDQSAEVEFQFAQQERQADLQILQDKLALSHDISERAAISIQMLDIEQQIRDAEIDEKVRKAKKDFADKKITKAALDEVIAEEATLKAKAAESDQLKKKAIIEQRDYDLAKQKLDISQNQFKNQEDTLHKEEAIAQTAAERRALELQILQITYMAKQQALQWIIDNSKDRAAVAKARDDLVALNANYALDRQGVMQQTRGPLESYFAAIPHDAARMNEALQSIEVSGIDGLANALIQVGKGWGAMRDAAIQALQDIASQLIKLGIQRMLFSLFGNAIMGGAGGLGGGAGAIAGGLPAGISAADFAGGFADGGFVSGSGTPTSDSIPAMLSNGEYVMSASAVQKFGVGYLDAMNGGRLPHMKGGGLLGALSFLSPLAFAVTHSNLLKYLSPAAFLFDKLQGGGLGALKYLSPAAFLGSKLDGGNGHTFNINVNAPNTGNPSRDRQTSLQQAADVRMAVAGAAAKGLI